MVINQD